MAIVYRDEYGIPHIDAINYCDAVKSIAYCHCEDDFYTIQLLLLATKQKSGHFDDWDGPYLDLICSFFDIPNQYDIIKMLSNEYLALIKSYIIGVNLYAEKHQNEILDKTIFPIKEKDVIIAQHLMEIIGIQLDKPYSFLKDSSEISLPTKQGSNAIAIGPKRSATKHALLAISPHQTIEGPFSFYEVHVVLKEEKCEIHGFILPCTFVIFMGTNFNIAWGSTASYPEMYNIYRVDVIKKIGSGAFFLLGDEKIALYEVNYRNYTKLYGKIPYPIFKSFYRSKLGNVISINGIYYLIDIPMLGKQFGFQQAYELSLCDNIDKVKKLLRRTQYSYLDFVCIDKYDDILFAHCSIERVKDDPKDHYINVLPQNKIIEIEKDLFYNNQNMVFLLNPECQYIVSVNQSPFMVTDTDTYDCKYKGLIYRRDNSRSKRAKDLIHSQNSIGVKELIEIQGDTKIIFPIIRGIDFTSLFKLDSNRYPSIGYLIEELKQWDGYAEKSSRGAAIFALLFERYKKYYRYSKNPDVIKIAEEKELVDCLRWVSKKLPKKYSLGDIQFLKRGKKKLPIAGIPDSLNTVRPYYYKGELIVEECSAFRMIVNLHDRISLTCHPLGASSNEDDVNYTSQMDMYQKNSYRKLKTMDNYKQYIKGYSI